jgi:hypothetical protein
LPALATGKSIKAGSGLREVPLFDMAETFVNENIDPSLRSTDPTKDIFSRIRSAGLISTPTPTPPADMDNDDDMPATPRLPVGPSNGPTNNPSVSYASLVKNKMALSDAASVALDQFCQVRICLSLSSRLIHHIFLQARAEDREVLLFAHVVQLLELFKKNEKMELWVISQDLDVRHFSGAILSPIYNF